MASSSINELPSAAETLTSQPPSKITSPASLEPLPSSNLHPMDDVEAVGEKRKQSSSIEELPLPAKTLTPQLASSDNTPTAPVEAIPSSDSHSMDDVEAVGDKRKRADDEEDKKTNLESSDPKKNIPLPWWKTSLCSYFRREASCSHGSECKYAHGEAELRMKPDNTWDPSSERGKKAKMMKMSENEKDDAEVLFTEQMMDSIDDDEGCGGRVVDMSLSKCVVHLPRKWQSDDLKKFLGDQRVQYAFAKKRRGMMLGFVTFEHAEQLQSGVEVLDGLAVNKNNLKISDVLPRRTDKSETKKSAKCAREAVTPLADLSYADQLEQKKESIMLMLKKLSSNARKACPNGSSLPEWVLTSRDRGGLSCNLEGIIESPITNGYRNKCEFSVEFSVQGKPTVGFSLGNFSAGVTSVE